MIKAFDLICASVILPIAGLLVWAIVTYPLQAAGVAFWVILAALIGTVAVDHDGGEND